MSLQTTSADTEELTPAQKIELVERVASSAQFRRSVRLREFLLYVGKASTRSAHAEIREQEIGIRVFGRLPDYDRGADNIVRVNATELRKRVDSYFAETGADEPYIFQIPRGAYKLVFSRRLTPEVSSPRPLLEPPVHSAVAVPPGVTVQRGSRGWMWVSLALVLVCAVLATFLYRATHPPTREARQPAVMNFWRSFTRDNEPGSQTDLVLSDESLSVMEDILRHPVSLPDYVDRSYTSAVDHAAVSEDRKEDVREVLRHNLLTLGSVLAAKQIVTLPGLTQHFHMTVPRLYPPDLMKRNNLIILGGKKSNPWAGFFDDALNFTLEYNTKTAQNYVLNRHPAPGEPAEYQPEGSSGLPSGIAVLAYVPNPSNTGHVLLLTGSDSDATAAAADFITSESSVEQLEHLFGRQQLPHFEVVLRTTRLSGTSFSSQVVASRIH